jgi:hypothetical protein
VLGLLGLRVLGLLGDFIEIQYVLACVGLCV